MKIDLVDLDLLSFSLSKSTFCNNKNVNGNFYIYLTDYNKCTRDVLLIQKHPSTTLFVNKSIIKEQINFFHCLKSQQDKPHRKKS